MRIRAVVAVLVLSLGLLGCGNLYTVKRHDAVDPSGLPFFSMTGACMQQSVYVTPYTLVTLKVSIGTNPVSADSVKLNGTGLMSADFAALLNELDKPAPNLGVVQNAWSNLKQRQAYNPYADTADGVLMSNNSKVVSVVDYWNEYDINQRKPISGSANAAFKLGANGTLTEVQGQTQDNTLSTILSALPLSDLIKSAAGIATKAAGAAEAEAPQPVKFSLEQEERLRTKTYSFTSALSAANTNCPTGAALTGASSGASLTISDSGAKDATKTPATKQDNSIGISGTISLPKALLSNSTADKTKEGTDDSSSQQKGSGKDGSSADKGSSKH